MHLLQYGGNGELAIISFDDNELPPYAILSHTWGADEEEVTFADIVKGDGKAKSGYEKIRLCGQQARRDGLEYFWIDTCCINKANKAEHSLAIRSMFRWYRNAARCYVYLLDVSALSLADEGEACALLWDSAFRECVWFTRGWTLQELLAPGVVEFFSSEWHKLGDKISLKSEIHEATAIPYEALKGAPLSRFSVDERFRWRHNRHTKLIEDAAYSMSGIFDVDIAPVYGEGKEEAFRRLHDQIRKREECFRDLRATDPRDDKKRIEETKGGLLAHSYRWVLDNNTFQQWRQDPNSCLLWIKGDPGKGKTMLLCGIINELQEASDEATVSYFFCQATDSRINSSTAVLRGLLYMLIVQQPSLISHVRKKHDHAGKNLFEDANAWLALKEIFVNVLQDPSLRPIYLVIDALNECVVDRMKLLEFVAKQSSVSSRVKWIVSSRNWPDIEWQLERAGHKVRLSLELNAESVAAAVAVFIQQKVDQLAQEKQYKADVRDAVLQHLTTNANDTFLWVALVCEELRRTVKRHVLKKLAVFPPGLDYLYERMMDQISESDDAEICRQVLAATAILYRPVTISELAALIEQLEDLDDLESVREIVGSCGSFLTLRKDTVYFVHDSVKDFLCTQAYDTAFPNGIRDVHRTIFLRSLAILSEGLHRNMYDLVAPESLIDKIAVPVSDPLNTTRYPCLYWIEHLLASTSGSVTSSAVDLQDGHAVDVFLKDKYLYWLEALSLCRSMSTGVTSIAKLEALVQEKANASALSDLVRDAHRFILSNRGVIEKYPLQTYSSALVFTTEKSRVREHFEMELPSWLRRVSRIHEEWSPCKQILEDHHAPVNAVIFLPDDWRLASASNDKTIRLWDTRTGECERVFRGHEAAINDVAASPNGQRLASAGTDKTVRLWDIATEECLIVLDGHRSSVRTVAFSPEGRWLASGSNDKTIRVWNAVTHEFERALQHHRSGVNHVVFSPDGTLLASASNDKTVQLWSTTTFDCCITLNGHSSEVYSLAFSPDGQQLASASNDKTIRIWDINTGKCNHVLRGHDSYVTSVAFSPDALRLASGSDDNTLCLWDMKEGGYENRFEGHQNSITSVAFSADSQQLASAAKDNMLRLWTATERAVKRSTTGHHDSVYAVSFSPDGLWFATASVDGTVRLWDTKTTDCIHVLEGHRADVYTVEFSQDCSQLASASKDKTVRIWNTHTGLIEQILDGHDSDILAVAFSPGGQWIASASNDENVRLWDVEYGECIHLLEGHRASVHFVAFSLDGQQLVSASKDQTVRIWDTNTGDCVRVASTQDAKPRTMSTDDPEMILKDVELLRLSLAESTSSGSLSTKDDSVVLAEQFTLSNKQLIRRIHVEDNWVFQNKQRLLWLPPDCRPSCSAVWENILVIGHSSGGVTCVEFNF